MNTNSCKNKGAMSTPRINMIGAYLKELFGEKVVKLSLDGGFTCPNRDGSKGTGGCIFCSADGSGDFASDIPGQIKLLSDKWPRAKYILYFQAHTNTYAPADELRAKFGSALSYPFDGGAPVGIAIATRPDCLADDVLDYLSELNEQTFLWVELGLQTARDDTAALINRCYPRAVYEDAVAKLTARGIPVVTHLIFGLPGESKEDMLDSVRYAAQPLREPFPGNCYLPASKHIFGLKFHLLNIIKGSRMENLYPGYVPFDSIESYIELVTDALRIVPPDITMHRLTADAARSLLIAPEWSYRKRTILNGIDARMRALNVFQGDMYE